MQLPKSLLSVSKNFLGTGHEQDSSLYICKQQAKYFSHHDILSLTDISEFGDKKILAISYGYHNFFFTFLPILLHDSFIFHLPWFKHYLSFLFICLFFFFLKYFSTSYINGFFFKLHFPIPYFKLVPFLVLFTLIYLYKYSPLEKSNNLKFLNVRALSLEIFQFRFGKDVKFNFFSGLPL